MCSRSNCWTACWPSLEMVETSAFRPWGSARATCTRHCAMGERCALKLPGRFAVWSTIRSATRRTREVVASANAPGPSPSARWPRAAAETAPQADSTAGGGRLRTSRASASTRQGRIAGQSTAHPGPCSRPCAEEAAVCATLAEGCARPREKTSRTWDRHLPTAALARSLAGTTPTPRCNTEQSAETAGTSSAQVSTTLRSPAWESEAPPSSRTERKDLQSLLAMSARYRSCFVA
mmetsp:Transcript_73120/g.218177  ORF Transcript_73120/g.218177 Transcript_73120/m.218177 type:complete len:235 (-) Transcript_73120:714-1418(-)